MYTLVDSQYFEINFMLLENNSLGNDAKGNIKERFVKRALVSETISGPKLIAWMAPLLSGQGGLVL